MAIASFWLEPRQTTRTIEDGKPAIRIFMHPHDGPHIVPAMALRRNLQAAPVVGKAIVGTSDQVFLRDSMSAIGWPT